MKIIRILSVGLLATQMLGCSADEPVKGGDFFSQHAVVYKVIGNEREEAEYSKRSSLTIASNQADQPVTEEFVVSLVKENFTDVTIKVSVSPEEVQKYNQIYGTDFLPFPKENVQVPEKLVVKAGNVASDVAAIQVSAFEQMLDNTPYMFAVTTSSDDVRMLHTSQTLFYTFEKVRGQIKKTTRINRQEYFSLENKKSISSTFTLEGLIFIEKLRGPGDEGEAGISTFMGVERETLLRFGDSGIQPNQLQVHGGGTHIDFDFKTGRWYHIAVVSGNGRIIAYVDGEKISEFNRTGSLVGSDPFYIGKSYSDVRGIEARFAELRIWKTARTAEEVRENIYETDPNNQDLWAYWKMNEVKDGKILDASPNGVNLVLYGQSGKSGQQKITIFEEETPVKIN